LLAATENAVILVDLVNDMVAAVHILTDCCGASSDEDHHNPIKTLSKIGKIVDVGQLQLRY
jgi:hypothetical protein